MSRFLSKKSSLIENTEPNVNELGKGGSSVAKFHNLSRVQSKLAAIEHQIQPKFDKIVEVLPEENEDHIMLGRCLLLRRCKRQHTFCFRA